MTTDYITKIETLDHSLNYGGVDVIINDIRKTIFNGNELGYVKASFNSCRGYALYNKEDPEESIQRAISLGHEQVWISLKCGVITNSPDYYKLEAAHWSKAPVLYLGCYVQFEDNIYMIIAAPNNNFSLKLQGNSNVCK